jgi:FlaA1/EpsC-like NDP-sugar epimerase
MIRHHGSALRTLLVLVDGTFAVVLLVVLAALRFGADWETMWSNAIPQPAVVVALYAVGWVTALALNDLYRLRARWSLRSEAWDLLKATALMALVTLSFLFVLRLPDVSRLFLLFLFPAQYVLTLLTRAAIRLWFRSLRRRG